MYAFRTASSSLLKATKAPVASAAAKRALHSSSPRHAFSKFLMPAMSPTMTEGGVATWKVSEGSSFSAGDVLLEIETDKATMDVEAQDDGILAKIVIGEGEKNVQVGKMIAILAEEGDDLAKAESEVGGGEKEAPKTTGNEGASQSAKDKAAEAKKDDSSSSSKSSAPNPDRHSASLSTATTSRTSSGIPLFPSVQRLLHENQISRQDAESKIKATGRGKMLTKGDVLAYLGKASSPTGSYKPKEGGIAAQGGSQPLGHGKKAESMGGSSSAGGAVKSTGSSESLTAIQLRSAILAGLAQSSKDARAAKPPITQIILPEQPVAPAAVSPLEQTLASYGLPPTPTPVRAPAKKDWLDGLI